MVVNLSSFVVVHIYYLLVNMQRLNERERISLLMMRGWGELKRSYVDVKTLFNDTFRLGLIPISKSTVSRTITRFNDTGSVKDRPRSGRPSTATNEEKSLDVLLSFIEDPHTSIRKTSQQHEICKFSIQKILKTNKFHPFKVNLVQELNEDDFDRRVEFCEEMMARIVEDPNFASNIVFSDEATFQLNGTLNRHNCRYWAEQNPNWMWEDKTQYPQKLNVWAGILNDQLIGPFFIEGNLTAAKYEDMLRTQIVPRIIEVTGANFEHTWFQQDGAAAHYGRNVRQYLNNVFIDRWIGRRGDIEWPARSPDLTPLDYFLWGYLKDRVYKTKPQNLDELRQRIIDECTLIPAEHCRNSINSFYHRLGYCQETEGHQFEHLLK